MKQIVENKKDIIIFAIIFIISFIIFIPFLGTHYSTDSYYIVNKGYKNYVINNSLKDGRLFMATIGYIAHLCNIPFDIYNLTLTILALFTNCVTIMALKNIIINYKKEKKILPEILITFISYFTIFNFTFIENMLFVECFVMSLSILFYMVAAKILTNKNKFYIIKTLLLVLCGVLCYQGTISMYLISILVFSLLKNNNYKQVIKDLIEGGITLIFGCLIQMMAIKCCEVIFGVQQLRANDLKNLLENIGIAIQNLYNIIVYTGFVYTKYLYLIFIIILEVIIIFKGYKEKLDHEIIINYLFVIFFSIIFGLAVSFISTSGFWSARIRYSIGTTIGYSLLYICCKTDLLENKKIINLVILFIFIIYSVSIVGNYVAIMKNSLRVNARDKIVAEEIIDYIEDYEQENNIKVEKLAVFLGPFKNKANYEDLKYRGSVLSWSSMRTVWSIEGTLEMYSDMDLELIEITKEKFDYYIDNVDENKDYMCIDDTLYVSHYVN